MKTELWSPTTEELEMHWDYYVKKQANIYHPADALNEIMTQLEAILDIKGRFSLEHIPADVRRELAPLIEIAKKSQVAWNLEKKSWDRDGIAR